MAITNGYATLDELKSRLDITGAKDDANLEDMIEAASRQIDGWCGRRFYAATETRTLDVEYGDALELDQDLLSVSSIVTDDGNRTYGTTWEVNDYEFGGPAPYQVIYPSPAGRYAFPRGRATVRVTGSWGYSATAPHAIREACLLQAARLYKRKDAPFGIAGSADHGQIQTITSIDPDVKQLLMQYRRFGLVV